MFKESFNKNDKVLKAYYIIFNVSLALMALACVIVGIYIAVTTSVIYGLLTLFGGALFCFLFWLFIRLIISYLVDIKLIRNKLYDKDNSDLSYFIDFYGLSEKPNNVQGTKNKGSNAGNKIPPTLTISQEQLEKFETELKALNSSFGKMALLNKLLSDKTISQTDYDYIRNKILRNLL